MYISNSCSPFRLLHNTYVVTSRHVNSSLLYKSTIAFGWHFIDQSGLSFEKWVKNSKPTKRIWCDFCLRAPLMFKGCSLRYICIYAHTCTCTCTCRWRRSGSPQGTETHCRRLWSERYHWQGPLRRGQPPSCILRCYILVTTYVYPVSNTCNITHVCTRVYTCFFVHVVCDWIWEKRALHAVAEFLFAIAYSFKIVIATDLKRDMTVLQSSHYTHWKFCSTPISDFGCGDCQYRMQSKIGHFMPHLLALPFQVRT